MDKLKMQSKNLVEENIEFIEARFPNCITESMEDGKLVKKVDFDLLRQELSSILVEGRDERYRLDWAGKRQAILTANSPIAKTLRPCWEESVNFDTTENLYIEGDNLDVLKLLHETYLNKVKMIYIDPPYNTGNDFVYNDDFAEDSNEYLERSNQTDEQGNRMTTNKETSGRYHSDWLSMMYMRLKLARDLLTDNGVIFISIDDNEQANLKKICDEVFGEDNFVNNIIWHKKYGAANDAKYLSDVHDFILVYCKNKGLWKPSLFERPQELNDKYSNPDNDPRGPWIATNLSVKTYSKANDYIITSPAGLEFSPPPSRCWVVSKAKYEEMYKDNRITFGKDGRSRPYKKTFLSEVQSGIVPTTIWSYNEAGHNVGAKSEIRDLFADTGFAPFDTPKPTKLVKRLLQMGQGHNSKCDDIILDFFSGSATTAHAVMQLNAEDGGNRKFVMVQLPEETDEKSEAYKAGYKNICEIGKERIRRAGNKIADENRITAPNLDIGFRVLKLAESNMRDVFYNPKEYDQSMILGLDSSIKEDRTEEDILFQVMLDKGVSLSSKIEKRTAENGKQNFYLVGNTEFGLIDLICCLDKKIDTDAVKEIAKLNAECVVFLDSGIANDSTRANIQQIFSTYSPKTKVEVL